MVEIKGSRVTLRSYEKDDVARIAEIGNNEKIAQNMVGTFPFPYTLEEAGKWVELAMGEEKNKTNFVIIFEGEIVGGAGFDLGDGDNLGVANGGYWLGEDYWGKGIGTEVWKVVRDYAFENFDIRRMGAGVYSWNPASMRVQEKCGFKKEGVKRSGAIRFGKIGDEVIFGLLREEWEALK